MYMNFKIYSFFLFFNLIRNFEIRLINYDYSFVLFYHEQLYLIKLLSLIGKYCEKFWWVWYSFFVLNKIKLSK